jgi:hypothetical protein
MKTKPMTYLFLSVLICSNCWAQLITVRGAVGCGDWVKERKQETWSKVISEARAISYLSGLAIGTDKDFLRGTGNESLFLWIDNYCQRNPLEDIYDAGYYLSLELIKNKK